MKLSEYIAKFKIPHEQIAHAVGVSVTSIYRYSSGSRRPRQSEIHKIAHFTKGEVTANDFYDLPDIPKRRSRKPKSV